MVKTFLVLKVNNSHYFKKSNGLCSCIKCLKLTPHASVYRQGGEAERRLSAFRGWGCLNTFYQFL